MIDFHSHLVPGVDDGAATLEETRAALSAYLEQGVRTVVTTPHLAGSLTTRPAELADALVRLDEAWEGVAALAAAEFPELRVERGFEVMLDTPAPDLADPRLRLAGTRFVLVEFPFMAVPPNAAPALFELKMAGWMPILAHPERYGALHGDVSVAEEWRRVGAHLQGNGASLIGKYGPEAQRAAWRLLHRGWLDYVCSDYHARGNLHVRSARETVLRAGGEEQAVLLFETNPGRMLEGKPPLPVPPLVRRPAPLWKRLFRGER